MHLSGLRSLYRSMKDKGMFRVRFPYSHGGSQFDVFFFTDETPFCLMFGMLKFNLAFEWPVTQGFEVVPLLPPDQYKALCKALGLTYDPSRPFTVRAFLEEFNAHIPGTAPDTPVRPEDVATYRRDVEENEKIYFLKWRDNTKLGKNVTPENLLKTKRLLGYDAFLACKKRNISSCWTDIRDLRRDPSRLEA